MSVSLMYLRRAALFTAALLVLTFAVAASPVQAQETLRAAADAQGLRIGAAVATGPLAGEAQYRDTLAAEFNSVTAENAMKWESLQPNQGQFTWDQADAIVDFAQQNGQAVYGHTLVWHSQTPGWVQSLPPADLAEAMETHISTVVGRYADDVEAWDVANEVIDDNANLRNSFWLQQLGPGYIADAFELARAADPDAKLYINDYNIEGINAKSDAYYNLVQDLLAAGVPIDGIGMQGHLILGQVPSSIQANIERFADLGLEVRITELDIRIQLPADSNELEQQAADYAAVVDACSAVDGCVGITTWGFTDAHSWVPGFFDGQGAALPFDESYTKKPAYFAMLEELGGEVEPDTVPPSQPGVPVLEEVTATTATLSWAASTDEGGSGLAGYDVYLDGEPAATMSVPSVTLTGLTPETSYEVAVIASDGAGNVSPPSPTEEFTTDAGAATACTIGYDAAPWTEQPGQGGYTAHITITNTGATGIDGWALTFDLPTGQALTHGWSADWTVNGQTLTATNLTWNQSIPAGGATTIGLNGSWTGTYTDPESFTLNGEPCGVS